MAVAAPTPPAPGRPPGNRFPDRSSIARRTEGIESPRAQATQEHRPAAPTKGWVQMPRLAPGLTFGPRPVDWQGRISVEGLRRERAERMRAVMRRHGVPSLLATGASHCRYLTGLKGPEYTPHVWYVAFFAESEPVVWAHAGFVTQWPQEAPWIKEWRLARSWLAGIGGPEASAEEAERFAAGVADELAARGLSREPLGVLGFDDLAQRKLRDRGLNVRSGWPLMHEAEAVKGPNELLCLHMATTLGEVAWHRIYEAMRPGLSEEDLIRIGWDAIRMAGSDEPAVGVRSGPLTFERGVKDTSRIIEAGDLVYANLCGTRYLGYGTCLYRTFIVGRQPTPRENDWYRRLVDRMDAVIDAIRPGATTADAARHFAPASAWGYEDEASVLTIEFGHGIGLRQYEMPAVNRLWSLAHPQVFEPGMVIAVESREGEPGQGGVRLEDMVLVTPDGPQLLDHFPRDHILVAAPM
jgi:Xaa-Pro dipeptidase